MAYIPDALLQEIFERRCTVGRVELLIRSSLTRSDDEADEDGFGATTSIGWRAAEPTRVVDLTVRRAKTREPCTDVILESWTPLPPAPPCRTKKVPVYLREKDYHEPYMERVLDHVELKEKTATRDFKHTFQNHIHYFEPYLEELVDFVAAQKARTPKKDDKLKAAVADDGTTLDSEPSETPSVYSDSDDKGIQTEIALGPRLLSDSIASIETESAGDDHASETTDVTQAQSTVADRTAFMKEWIEEKILETVINIVRYGRDREVQPRETSPQTEAVLLYTTPRTYYEPYMRRLAREHFMVQMVRWDDHGLPEVPELSLPMWDSDLRIPHVDITHQFDENWEWLVKNNESLFLGKYYEIALSQYFMDPTSEFGFLSGPVPDLRSVTSAIAQRSPEIMNLLHKLGPMKSRQWLCSLGKELKHQHYDDDDDLPVDIEGLMLEIFPEATERTIAVHLPEQSANGRTLVLQFGDMKVVMTCQENAFSTPASVVTNIMFVFSKIKHDSIIRHKMKTDIIRNGLRTVMVLRCKDIFIISVDTDSIVNKGLYLDPREIPRKIVSYQLMRNEEEHEESAKLLLQGGSPFIITVPDSEADGMGKVHGKSVEFVYDNTARENSKSTVLSIGGRPAKFKIPFEGDDISCTAALRYRNVEANHDDTVQIIDLDTSTRIIYFKVVVGNDVRVVTTKNMSANGRDVIVNLPFTPGVTNCRVIEYEGTNDTQENMFGSNDHSCNEEFQLGPISKIGEVEEINFLYLHESREHYIFSIDNTEQLRFTRTFIGGQPAVIINIIVPDRDKHILGLEVLPQQSLFLVLTIFPPQSDLSFDIPMSPSGIFVHETADECFPETDNEPDVFAKDAFKLSYKIFVDEKEIHASKAAMLVDGSPIELTIPISGREIQRDKFGKPKIRLKVITDDNKNKLSKAVVSVTLGSSLVILPLRKESVEHTSDETTESSQLDENGVLIDSESHSQFMKAMPTQEDGVIPPTESTARALQEIDKGLLRETTLSMFTETHCSLRKTAPRKLSTKEVIDEMTLVCDESKTIRISQDPRGSDHARILQHSSPIPECDKIADISGPYGGEFSSSRKSSVTLIRLAEDSEENADADECARKTSARRAVYARRPGSEGARTRRSVDAAWMASERGQSSLSVAKGPGTPGCPPPVAPGGGAGRDSGSSSSGGGGARGEDLAPMMSMLRRVQRDLRALERLRSAARPSTTAVRRRSVRRLDSCVRLEVLSRSPSVAKLSSKTSAMTLGRGSDLPEDASNSDSKLRDH